MRYENIGYTIPIFEDILFIGCGYNYTEEFNDSDLLDAYLDFQWPYYVSILLTFIFFISSWKFCSFLARKISRKLRDEIQNARLPPYWIMICAILDQDQFPAISRAAFSTLSILFSLFFYVLIDCFMLNTMSADLVTITEPKVVQSYQDIIDREGLKVIFFPGMDEEALFMSAPEGSVEAQIWEKKESMEDLSADTLARIWFPLQTQENVGILRHWLVLEALSILISKTRETGNF